MMTDPARPGEPAASASVPAALMAAGPVPRVISVDVLRGLTIFLMIFVNGMGSAAPSWLHHLDPPRADGMTLADVVFPMFLFIVGVSIPLAFERGRDLALTRWAQAWHILGRTAGLLIMGVVVMNVEDLPESRQRGWGLLAFSALILAWCSVPREAGRSRQIFLAIKGLGIVGLGIFLASYRRGPVATTILGYGPVGEWVWLRTEWWGILGLIGWAYLTVALLTLILGHRREWLMGAMGLLMVAHLATHERGLFGRVADKPWLAPVRGVVDLLARGLDAAESYVSLGDALGSLAAITMAGCLLGSILRRDSDVRTHRARLAWALVFVVGLVLAAGLTDTFEGINKIGATPTWCFLSAALAATIWMLLYAVIDIAGLRAWSLPIRPAGANPLLAYFLHPITVWLVGLSGFGGTVLGYTESPDPWVVVGGAAGMALFVCLVTGGLAGLGLRVRL